MYLILYYFKIILINQNFKNFTYKKFTIFGPAIIENRASGTAY